MNNSELIDFQKKYSLSNTFIEYTKLFFDRLVEYGYISIFKKKAYMQKLYDNIDIIYVGTNNNYDYKSGFYDANKKVLYIKDENNISALFLRLLYVITTKEINDNTYSSGYLVTKMSNTSYKLVHENFSINRAVMSNLVCILCNELPQNIRLVPSYHTYNHNFLGYKISTNNDIYGLEGKILSELCFALNIDEDILFSGIFNPSPVKYLGNILVKKGFHLKDELFKNWDELSRKYSTYCKLSYLSSELNKNYLEIKKNILNSSVDELKFQKKCIEGEILKVISSIYEQDDFEVDNIEVSLSEVISNYETRLLELLDSIQNIISTKMLVKPPYMSEYEYANRLTQFNDIMIIPNQKLEKAITKSILEKLLPKDEITSVNLTVKIKYSVIKSILSTTQFAPVSNLIQFSLIHDLAFLQPGVVLAILSVNKSFSKLLQIDDLNFPLEKMKKPPEFIPVDSLAHLINSDYSNMYVGNLEKIYTTLRFKYPEYSSLSLNDVYIFEYLNQGYLIVANKDKIDVVQYNVFKDNYDMKKLELTENYSLFNSNKKIELKRISNLPVISNKLPKI